MRQAFSTWLKSAEYLDRHPDLVLVVIDIFHDAVEIVERAIVHPHHFAGFEQNLGPRLVHTFLDTIQDRAGLLIGDGCGPVGAAADKTENFRDLLDQMPTRLVHFHLHENVAWEELALAAPLLSAAHLHALFGGNEDVAELIFQSVALDPLFQGRLHLMFVIRVRVDDVPPKIRHGSTSLPGQAPRQRQQ